MSQVRSKQVSSAKKTGKHDLGKSQIKYIMIHIYILFWILLRNKAFVVSLTILNARLMGSLWNYLDYLLILMWFRLNQDIIISRVKNSIFSIYEV